MACSESRTLANRENAKKSTGPRTAEGKAIARRNALRHGMAGEGVVLLPADEAKLAERQVTWAEDFRPRTAAEAYLVSLAALHSVKLDRCAAVESAGAVAEARAAAEGFEPSRRARIAAIQAVIRQCDRIGNELRRTGTLDGEYLRKLIELLGPFEDHDPRRADLVALAFEARPKSSARSTLPPELLAVCRPPTVASKPSSPAPGSDPGVIDAAEAGRRASRAVLAGLIAGHRAERVREVEALAAEIGSEEARALAIAAAGIDAGTVGQVARRYESANENGLFRTLRKLERLQAREVLGDDPETETEPDATGLDGGESEASEADEAGREALDLGSAPVVIGPSSVPEPLAKKSDTPIEPRPRVEGPAGVWPSAPLPNEPNGRAETRRSPDLPNEPNDRAEGRGSADLPNEPNDPRASGSPHRLPNEPEDTCRAELAHHSKV